MEAKFSKPDLTRRFNFILDQYFDGKAANLFRASGVPQANLSGYKEGKEPNLDALTRIALACNVTTDWLLTGEGPMRRDDASHPPVDRSLVALSDLDVENESAKAYALIPRYDVHASAGYGAVVGVERIIDHMAFPLEWLKGIMKLDIQRTAMIYVNGDSMIPTLHPDDVVLVDMREQDRVSANAVYVIQVDGDLFVKRLQKMTNGNVVVKSDNPHYDTETILPGEMGRLNVVGKVVWAGRRM
ncbi:MAG: helix-turn-helix transcriptional regulator [Magnetococcales bacterium]|nr:helix-turn-helix transcriptional regulator [Magnetococcales bacterium]NGZ06609.1 helix-turn-helix transcriptional regulator [Magnetococcales bacterium]